MYTERWDMRLTDREVLIALSNLSKPTAQADIAESLGCTERTFSRALKRLRAKGYIAPIGDGRYLPYEGYTIFYEKLPDEIRMYLDEQ